MSRRDYRDELFGPAVNNARKVFVYEPFPDDPAPSPDDVVAECIRGPVNPKDVEAQRTGKARLDLLEPVAEREIAKALAFGADKYGVRNYVTAPINARVYVAAMKRHIDAWLEGEDHAADSGAHHLGHIGANVHVALAALAAGTFIDDRAVTAAKDTSISDPAKVE